jgi:hypothetical protein
MPEVFDVNFSKVVAWQYPLRPGKEKAVTKGASLPEDAFQNL